MSPASPSAGKTERLLNLVLALKSARRPVSKQRLRESIDDYRAAASTEAFDRMFERDKDDLRELGIQVHATVLDPFFDDEVGYRIDSSETSLPAISFEPDERVALALAARAWAGASISGSAAAALRKLRLRGVELDEAIPAGVEPRIRTKEPAFDPVHAALLARQPIVFDYRRADGTVTTRHVRPWALKSWHGRWYLAAYDLDRGEQRAFRLGRVVGPVRKKGKAGSYQVPPGAGVEVDLRGGESEEEAGTAVIRVRRGTGHSLRRRALREAPVGEGWIELEVPWARGRTEHDVAALGAAAVAMSPDDLVAAVRAALDGAARAHSGTHTEVAR
ncbi:MAG: WYL domain-containing protein [Intrasporangium sp.]|uniref:helix-turn-helix transcriptional regulator n=1 Tax=Intrasporangium sp. TaxID=1925024 RepID=UPI002648BFC1|nr:WYL domain-containing protein [Intrasporangium sp.]MDN5794692.1 WYL domain-containing protein [Intrasporangium sp.]